jgi:hypothetical protein
MAVDYSTLSRSDGDIYSGVKDYTSCNHIISGKAFVLVILFTLKGEFLKDFRRLL